MYPFKKNLLQPINYLILLLISMNAHAYNTHQNAFEVNTITYYPQWYVGGYAFKNGPRAAGETTLLSPLFETSDQLLFSSVRLLDKSSKPWEGSLALGYRCLNADHTNLVGLYGGVDRLRTTTGYYFNQINVGAEAWYQDWFLGGNVYQPYGGRQYSAPNPQSFSFRQNGGYRNIGFTENTESVLPGVDAQIGRTLVDGLTVYGGGYYFHAADTKTLSGPKVEAEYVFYAKPKHKILGLFDRVSVEGIVTDDAVRGINYYGGLTVGMSWGNSNANLNLHGTERHMVDPIRRDVDVITEDNAQHVDLPANIRDVDTLDDFNQALTDDKADVIAVHGQIKGVKDATIDRNLYLTGNTYQFVRDNKPMTITVAEGGELVGEPIDNTGDHGLLHIKGADSNITIRDLNLFVDETAPLTIFHSAEDGSMGILNVERILTNGSLQIEVSGENNTATVDHITDSIFNTDKGGSIVSISDSGVVAFIGPLGALNFRSDNAAQLTIGEISNNIIETQSAYNLGILFRTTNGNMTIENINMNFISTNDGRSAGLLALAEGGAINIKNITENSIDTNSGGISFITRAFGELNIHQISDNEIKVTDTAIANGCRIVSGIGTLSEKDSSINFEKIINNNISIDCRKNNILFGINIDADEGNIVGKEINGNQIVLENPDNYSVGLHLRQWRWQWGDGNPNFIKLDSIAFNQVTLTNDSGNGFDSYALAPDGITVNSFAENIVTRDDFYNISE